MGGGEHEKRKRRREGLGRRRAEPPPSPFSSPILSLLYSPPSPLSLLIFTFALQDLFWISILMFVAVLVSFSTGRTFDFLWWGEGGWLGVEIFKKKIPAAFKARRNNLCSKVLYHALHFNRRKYHLVYQWVVYKSCTD